MFEPVIRNQKLFVNNRLLLNEDYNLGYEYNWGGEEIVLEVGDKKYYTLDVFIEFIADGIVYVLVSIDDELEIFGDNYFDEME